MIIFMFRFVKDLINLVGIFLLVIRIFIDLSGRILYKVCLLNLFELVIVMILFVWVYMVLFNIVLGL